MASATQTRKPSKDNKDSKPAARNIPVMRAVEREATRAAERPGRRDDGEEQTGATGASRESLDKVRDILFGAQMRDSDQRFSRLEDRLVKEATDVREENRKRLDSLEAFVRKELQALTERLKAEQTQRIDALREASQELKETAKAFEKRLTDANEQAAENQRNLRQELLDQSKTLREEVQQSAQTLLTTMERSAGQLRADKIDRAALADLFTELAMRLNEGVEKPARR